MSWLQEPQFIASWSEVQVIIWDLSLASKVEAVLWDRALNVGCDANSWECRNCAEV